MANVELQLFALEQVALLKGEQSVMSKKGKVVVVSAGDLTDKLKGAQDYLGEYKANALYYCCISSLCCYV